MNMSTEEKVFISLFMTIALGTLAAIIWLMNTSTNCWDKYHTEQTAIEYCEHHNG